jgi:transcriptional regulator with XRE-family HTH domain
MSLRFLRVDSDKLQRLREERVLSQRELARLAGITHTTYWNLEHGFREARPKTIRKVAEALGVKPGELTRRGKEGGEEAREQ